MPHVDYRVTTGPAVEVLTRDEAKAHCNLEGTDSDALIDAIIPAARALAEELCGRKFVTQTVTLVADGFPESAGDGRYAWDGHHLYPDPCLRLPLGRTQAVTSISYVDENGDTQTLDAADYRTDFVSEPARVEPAYGTSWPATRDVIGAVTVVFTTWYGDTAASVPVAIVQAVKLLVGHFYLTREPINIGNITADLKFTVDALLAPYRVMG